MGLTGQANAQARQKRIGEIYAIAGPAGISRAALKAEGSVSYAEIVAAVDEATPGGLIELTWKTCSGYAHGDWCTTARIRSKVL